MEYKRSESVSQAWSGMTTLFFLPQDDHCRQEIDCRHGEITSVHYADGGKQIVVKMPEFVRDCACVTQDEEAFVFR